MRAYLNFLLVGLVAVALTGCATTETANGPSAANDAGASARLPSDYQDVVLDLSQPLNGFLRNGIFVPVREIADVRVGATREQVREQLGPPISESSPQWWFYNLNLPLEGLDDYLVCQYRVNFNGDNVAAVSWRRPQCQARYDMLLAATPPPVTEPERITLSSDVLFEYKSATLSQAGERALDDAARVVLQEVELSRIDVVGHADRIGGDAYNMDLSERRARAVGAYLAAQGIPPAMIFIEGRGYHEPVVTCTGDQVTEELKRCLQPNRRVEITINAVR